MRAPFPGVVSADAPFRIGMQVKPKDELAKFDGELAAIVDLKFFCGFSFAEIGAMRGVSERTVQRQWEKARLLLFRALRAP